MRISKATSIPSGHNFSGLTDHRVERVLKHRLEDIFIQSLLQNGIFPLKKTAFFIQPA